MAEADSGPTEEQRVKQLWSRVPYHEYGRVTAPAAADVVEFVDVSAGEEVLDVACGTGNTAITAARRGAEATGIDLNPDMVEWARENADLADVDVEFRQGDATDLPVADDAYDATLSTFGHHLAGDPVAATRELARVTRPGGRVGFTAYAFEGGARDVFEALGEYHPELTPEEAIKPYYWGDREFVAEQFGDLFESLSFDEREIRMQATTPTHFVEYMLEIIGAVRAPYEQVPEDDREDLYEEFVTITENRFERNAGPIKYLLVRGEV